MIKPMYSYSDCLDSMKNFYSSAAIGNADSARDHLENFYAKARCINPSVARMSIQEAQNEIYLDQFEKFFEGNFDENEFKTRKKNIKLAIMELNHDPRISELEKRIKELYKNSYKKRLTLIPCILDNDKNGLSKIRPNKNIAINEQMIESKTLKKVMYVIRKLFTK